MRIVIFSDVHGNLVALEAVLAAIGREDTPDLLFVAGDLVLSGPRPAETLARLRSLDGARFVKGNTDQDLIEHTDDPEVAFARKLLSEDDIAFVRGLPFEQRLVVAPDHELLIVHANPHDLMGKIKPDSPNELLRPWFKGVAAEVVAFGHHHVPFVRQFDGRTLVDVASVGLPRDGDPRAVYAVLSWECGTWHIEHRRVWFDMQAVTRDYSAVGFPNAEQVAQRLV
jgi:putative phosphoesterase